MSEDLQMQLNRCVPEDKLYQLDLASLLIDSDSFPVVDPMYNKQGHLQWDLVKDLILFVRAEPWQVITPSPLESHAWA